MRRMSMNKVILMGRIVRDPEIKYSSGATQTAIARYTLAIDRAKKTQSNDQSADFIPCIAFGNQGEFASKYLKRGIKVAVIGRIQTGSYTNKEGKKVYTTDVIVDEHYFAESKNGSGQNAGMTATGQTQTNSNTSTNSGWLNIPEGFEDDSLPFS